MKMLSGSRKYKKYFYYLTCDAVRFVVHIEQCQWSCTIRILSYAMTSSSFSLQGNFKCNYLTRTYSIKYESYVHDSAEDIV
jgi:hypothetical protein